MTKRSVSIRTIGLLTLLYATIAYLPDAAASREKSERPATVNATERGFPWTNFKDGFEIAEPGQVTTGASGKSMTAGDFDSDGTPDLVTIDINGTLRFLKGNVKSIFPDSNDTADRFETDRPGESPLLPPSKYSVIPSAPDRIEAGDFTADGKTSTS